MSEELSKVVIAETPVRMLKHGNVLWKINTCDKGIVCFESFYENASEKIVLGHINNLFKKLKALVEGEV